MRSSKNFLGVAVLAGLLLPATSHGAAFIYNLGEVFSGDTPSTIGQPWVTALFEDVAPGQVRLTVANTALVGKENLDAIYFNLNPALDATLLSFNLVGSSGAFDLPNQFLGTDEFKADGDGKYDIRFTFSNARQDANRFNGGESLVLDITGIPTLNVFDFTYLSAPAGGAGPFYAAGHIQRIESGVPGTTSGWISPIGGTYNVIPEPGAASLLVGGLLLFALRARRS
jgi:hypothetical protein